jgi:hypothetical protein
MVFSWLQYHGQGPGLWTRLNNMVGPGFGLVKTSLAWPRPISNPVRFSHEQVTGYRSILWYSSFIKKIQKPTILRSSLFFSLVASFQLNLVFYQQNKATNQLLYFQMETKKSITHKHNDLFSSLISDIKSYTGNDPLLPWLRYS